MIEDGLFSLFKANIPDFLASDGSYNMFYCESYDPVPSPFCIFRRYKREGEPDLSSKYPLLVSDYIIEIFHTDSWALLDLQERIRKLIEGLPQTLVGGIFIQSVVFLDDFNTTPPLTLASRQRLFQGVLDFEIVSQQ